MDGEKSEYAEISRVIDMKHEIFEVSSHGSKSDTHTHSSPYIDPLLAVKINAHNFLLTVNSKAGKH